MQYKLAYQIKHTVLFLLQFVLERGHNLYKLRGPFHILY